MYDSILSKILNRTSSLFKDDIYANSSELEEKARDSRILVIGAAGSVGSSFLRQVIAFKLSCLHLVDLSENNLVEVVRDLRSSQLVLPEDFQTLPIALGSIEFDRFLAAQKKYDYILNFSAMKHVRSEKDPFCLMRMYRTNVLYPKELLEELSKTPVRKFFSVSSDKAVNPASVMGATKAFMERVLLAYSEKVAVSTARFANVAFSDGSLLYGFHKRIEKRQPIVAPVDIRRYLISHEEAGELCLLSCFLGENRDIYFPIPNEPLSLIPFSRIAEIFLESSGMEPEVYATEEEAKDAASRLKDSSRKWPCYFFSSDTSGEKPFEEFYTPMDKVDFSRYGRIGVIHAPMFAGAEAIMSAVEGMERIKKSSWWRKADMVKAIGMAVPEFDHKEKDKNLDSKM